MATRQQRISRDLCRIEREINTLVHITAKCIENYSSFKSAFDAGERTADLEEAIDELCFLVTDVTEHYDELLVDLDEEEEDEEEEDEKVDYNNDKDGGNGSIYGGAGKDNKYNKDGGNGGIYGGDNKDMEDVDVYKVLDTFRKYVDRVESTLGAENSNQKDAPNDDGL